MKCLWGLICQNSIIDSNTNNQSLINILEEITITSNHLEIKDEKIPISFDLAYLFYEPKLLNNIKVDAVIEILDSAINIIEKNKVTFPWEKNKKRMRLNVRINSLPIKESGTYFFRVKYKKENEKS